MNPRAREMAVRQLSEFVSFATVSAQPKRHASEFEHCANWLANQLKEAGLGKVRILETPGFPIIYAEWMLAGKRAPTVLIYGHYDVQPVDPLGEWRSPPFKPMVRGDFLYGRGASDDKGQLFLHIKAVESILKERGRLPVNIRFVLEGEEEIGSPNLGNFLNSNKRLLRSDLALMSDTAMPSHDLPALTYGLRGVLYVELTIRHALDDLHSGNFGGAVNPPAQVLCEVVARLFNKNGSIAIDQFYDDVALEHPGEAAYIRSHSPSQGTLLGRSVGARISVGGERGFTMYHRTALRPSLTVCAIKSGYDGQGMKAVVPSEATAKLDIRLVPNQDPNIIFASLKKWLSARMPPGCTFSLTKMLALPAVVEPVGQPAFMAAKLALWETYGKEPILVRSGGTVPVVHLLKQTLGIPTVMMGFGLPSDHVHAPNERFYLPNFFKGMEASRSFLYKIGEAKGLYHNQ